MKKNIQSILESIVADVKDNTEGKPAAYIPELESVDPNLLGIAVQTIDGKYTEAGDIDEQEITLQSVAKVAVLTGLLDEFGPQKVYSWVRVEPSGDDFASIARLDQFGPLPSNPMLNAGAISLCSRIPGNHEQQLHWLEVWMEKLFGERLIIDLKVFASERRTGDRNRSLAYLMKSTGVITNDIDNTLENYFYLCSYTANLRQMTHFPMLLANLGKNPQGEQIISADTARQVIAIMATCGLYNESGTHLVRTGFPAKSGVSGAIIAVAPKHGGIATISPRVNRKGTSIRGAIMLESFAEQMDWHFAG